MPPSILYPSDAPGIRSRPYRCGFETQILPANDSLTAVVSPNRDGSLTSTDIADIRSGGRDPDQVDSQLKTLRKGGQASVIRRPARPGDGITRLQDHDRAALIGRHEEARQAGRVSSFVPASGSGTRLFSSLLQLHHDQETDLERVKRRAARGDEGATDALVV